MIFYIPLASRQVLAWDGAERTAMLSFFISDFFLSAWVIPLIYHNNILTAGKRDSFEECRAMEEEARLLEDIQLSSTRTCTHSSRSLDSRILCMAHLLAWRRTQWRRRRTRTTCPIARTEYLQTCRHRSP